MLQAASKLIPCTLHKHHHISKRAAHTGRTNICFQHKHSHARTCAPFRRVVMLITLSPTFAPSVASPSSISPRSLPQAHMQPRHVSHVRAHTHTHARTHAHTHAHTGTHARTHAHTRTHTHTHMHTHARTHACTWLAPHTYEASVVVFPPSTNTTSPSGVSISMFPSTVRIFGTTAPTRNHSLCVRACVRACWQGGQGERARRTGQSCSS